ncbi:hypothetical protein [Furfurilactobacillus entadae]|uniref:hypothetical protein n=1 Tax=Furfurilactobacillus entadae TaxID=2922307 RepID=UPI0035EB5948
MKNDYENQQGTRMSRHSQPPKVANDPVKKLRRPHGFLSFLVGLVFLVSLGVRLTVLSEPFMAQAVQSPMVVNQVHDEFVTTLTNNHLPSSIASDRLIKATLKTGVQETYAGEDLNFNNKTIKAAIAADVNQQASSFGLGSSTTVVDSLTNSVSGTVLDQLTSRYHNQTLSWFAANVQMFQFLTTVLTFVSGCLWLWLLISNHRRRHARSVNRQ